MWLWLKSLFGYAPHIDPPVFGPFDSEQLALAAARAFALSPDSFLEITTGTPSMVPLIPAARTYLVVRSIAFRAVRLGTVVSYHSPLAPLSSVTHRLVSGNTKDGFIPSGDNNRYSESYYRVTADNFIGEVVGIFPFVS